MIYKIFLPNFKHERKNKEKYKLENNNKKEDKSFQEILNNELEKYRTKENNIENK